MSPFLQGAVGLGVGIASGVISGLGIGGGTILIPALTFFFAVPQQEAQNINLIYFVPTALIALFVHKKEGNIEKSVVKPFVAAGVVSAAIGAFIAVWLSPDILRRLFGVFLLLMGASEIRTACREKGQPISNSDK